MKFEYINQDITEEDSGVIVHGVNCQGVMGSGVALAIRKKWPEVYEDYKSLCDRIEPKTQLLGLNNLVPIDSDLLIVNAFTQLNYGKDGKKYASLNAIEDCMNKLSTTLNRESIGTVKMPMIGCGLGGLDWNDVLRAIKKELNEIDIVKVYYL
mgnify:CR=1 FL=1